jgi:hypothetical protein
VIITMPTGTTYTADTAWVFRSKEVVTLWFYDQVQFVADWTDVKWSSRRYVDWFSVEEVS